MFDTALALLSSLALASPTAENESVPEPSVTNACPSVPSAVGRLNAVPPDVITSLLPSDSIFSLASVKCKPTFVGIITSVVAVNFILFPVIVKSSRVGQISRGGGGTVQAAEEQQ